MFFARLLSFVLSSLIAFGGFACSHVSYTERAPAADDLMDKKRRVIEQVTSIFENSTTTFQYGYSERLKDAYFRGITFGRIGFVSCMDGEELLELYESAHPNSALTPFLKIMRDSKDGKITCSQNADLLEAAKPPFSKVVRKMALRSDFRDAQDDLESRLYYLPAIAIGRKLGLKLPWSYLNLYDTNIQHGAEGVDGTQQIADKTTNSFGGKTPASGFDEVQWMTRFIAIRRHVLETGDPEWRDSVKRADFLLKIHTRDHNDFLDPFQFDAGTYGIYPLPAN